MSTRAFDLQAPAKFESFKLKNKKEAPGTSAPSSAPADTLLAQMSIDVKNTTSNGNHAVIDFQGDFRPILMALCFYAAQFYDALDVKQHSKVSPPSLVAYFLFVIYSFYLISDLEARPTPSVHTRFLSTPEFLDFKAFILQLPVPDFLVKFFQAAAPTADPRRPNITYVPSFACFSYYHDFGRLFPIAIFIQCHNFVISQKTNDAPEDLINKMMGLNVYGSRRIGNFFGQMLDDGTSNNSYAHQLFQAFEGVINPALARSRSQRNVYSRITHHVQPYTSTPNPYQLMMSCDEDNVSETMTLMRQIQTTISAKYKIAGPLASVIASLSGMNITIHGYSNFATPTWHNHTVKQNETSSTVITAKTFSTLTRFLVLPDRAPDTDLKYPTDESTIDKLLYLVKKGKKSATAPVHYPADSDLVTFSGRNTSVPTIRVLDPYDYNATTFHNIYLSGSIIESLEIDGSAVPLPNTDTVLDDENTQFLQSAIPLSDVHRATNIYYRTTGAIWAERRVPQGPQGQAAATLLFDISENRLPNFDQNIHGALPTSLPGFNIRPHVSLWTSIYSKIGFRLPNADEKEHSRPELPDKGKFLVWSPYRYYNGKVMTSTPENYFMLTNLRTVFGTNPPLGETAHFLEVLPVS
jgi:hypothetical protein